MSYSRELNNQKTIVLISIEEVEEAKNGDVVHENQNEQLPSENSHLNKRVDSLDIFRGFTVALMILVDDAGGDWPMIAHAPWNGCNLADFVMPFFLFIVGMAIPLALKRIPDRLITTRKVIFRTIKLLLWGILLQGGYSHAPDELTYGVDVKRIRWCGILQRIALSYLIVALLEIATKTSQGTNQLPGRFSVFKLVVGACILTIYLSVLYGVYVPDWQFTVQNAESPNYEEHFTVTCGVRGTLNPPCNAVGYVDRTLLGINHVYHHPAWRRSKVYTQCFYSSHLVVSSILIRNIFLSCLLEVLQACTANSPFEGPLLENAPSWCHAPFEPEGILSSISAVLSTINGVHFGHVLVHIKNHTGRLKHWVPMGLTLLVLGLLLHFTNAIPLNKQLYSFSYVCVTSGAAAFVFSAFYFLVDILDLKFLFLPFKWIGMNAMLVFVMAAEGIFAGFINGWYYEDPHNTLVNWILEHVFTGVWHSKRVGILFYVIFAEILFWAVVAGIFHRLKIYWKL
ncbi:Heparan-alpha-glucosaminide N-acetyltransferase [Bienertia sinuspersici]